MWNFAINDILPDILNIDVLSPYWKRRKYTISYFLVLETGKVSNFIIFSYLNRGNETDGGCPLLGEDCRGGLCRMVVGSV